MILVDSSVLIDLLEKTPEWFEWCSERLAQAKQSDSLGINALVYAEISRTFKSGALQDQFLKATGIQYLHISPAAAFEASLAHRRYREAGGSRAATLPDFFIGAHARAEGYTLMTRDAKRISTYFPDVPVISPR
ncbi:MAG: PIN domain-containing protein [Burkholderiales bacterium]|nr:MAG: PIN domain-containing protein [Burkholderiales bacterium]